jgi:predicted phage terminase large subunit-like protein
MLELLETFEGKKQLGIIAKQIKKDVLTNSYYEFFKWAFKILHKKEKLVDNFHVKFLCDLLQEQVERIERNEPKIYEGIIINIPPRTSKSLICSVILNAWVWTRMPWAKFGCISYDDVLALTNAQYCRDILESDEFKSLFDENFELRNDANAKGYYHNNEGGYRLSKSMGSNITGFSFLFVVIDDPQNPKVAEQEVERESCIRYFEQSLFNRLTPIELGLRLIVMQRLHENDLTGYLLKKNAKDYLHICLPAAIDDNIEPKTLLDYYQNGLLDPIRLPKNILQSFLTTLNERGYIGQYQQKPSPGEGTIFKKIWFEVIDPQLVIRNYIEEPVHFFIDPAYTEKTENDPTAILTCFKRNNQLFILDCQEIWLEFDELCKFIINYVSSYSYSEQSRIFIEPKASGKSIVQSLRNNTMLNVMEAESPDKDKVTRSYANQPIYQSQRVKLLNGAYYNNYINQLTTFPKGSHDDMVDVTNMATKTLLVDNLVEDVSFI